MQFRVLGLVDDPHAAFTELGEDLVVADGPTTTVKLYRYRIPGGWRALNREPLVLLRQASAPLPRSGRSLGRCCGCLLGLGVANPCLDVLHQGLGLYPPFPRQQLGRFFYDRGKACVQVQFPEANDFVQQRGVSHDS